MALAGSPAHERILENGLIHGHIIILVSHGKYIVMKNDVSR
jgi:hypothetical protein